MTSAVVVGSGPNGLAAAVTLAASGADVTVLEASDVIGGGTRSGEVTLPGLRHDECSGFHPLAIDNAFARSVPLQDHGLRWAWPEVQYSHPLDNGRGAAVWRSVDRTVDELGSDGPSYRRLFGRLDELFDDIATEFLQPMVHVPRHPLALARFGAYAALPATWLARRWQRDETRALYAGVAAHAFRPLGTLMSSAIGVALGTAAHRFGWPVAVGGSAAVTTAMAGVLASHGGRIETGAAVRRLEELAGADLVMLDTSPSAAARILDGHQPARVARAYRRYRHGPAAFQVAFAVEGGIPWTHEPSRRAGTVHVGGTIEQIAAAERDVWRGRMPSRPFVLVGQQSLADPGRAHHDTHPVDVYAHVPAGWRGDATQPIVDQIERYAPGFTRRIRGSRVRAVSDIEGTNVNYVGGDIVNGANTPRQLVFRPRVALDPYPTGVPGVYLCSAATPPGAGAHGMCGWHAARSALRSLDR
ncbi:MAG: NAD(P)/FAD-dependent oxidoreductase [Nitriliruptor sp.]|nr:MAG: NAD(P)/FAD-dependent oxidoreductase [Nitriliruptor sp.]